MAKHDHKRTFLWLNASIQVRNSFIKKRIVTQFNLTHQHWHKTSQEVMHQTTITGTTTNTHSRWQSLGPTGWLLGGKRISCGVWGKATVVRFGGCTFEPNWGWLTSGGGVSTLKNIFTFFSLKPQSIFSKFHVTFFLVKHSSSHTFLLWGNQQLRCRPDEGWTTCLQPPACLLKPSWVVTVSH